MRTTIASNKTRSNQTIDEYRVRASRLLKELRLGDAAAALSAGRRLQSVPAWAAATPEELVAARDAVGASTRLRRSRLRRVFGIGPI